MSESPYGCYSGTCEHGQTGKCEPCDLRAALEAEKERRQGEARHYDETIIATRAELADEKERREEEFTLMDRKRRELETELATEHQRADEYYKRWEMCDADVERLTAERDALRARLKELDGCPTVSEWRKLVQAEAEGRAALVKEQQANGRLKVAWELKQREFNVALAKAEHRANVYRDSKYHFQDLWMQRGIELERFRKALQQIEGYRGSLLEALELSYVALRVLTQPASPSASALKQPDPQDAAAEEEA